MQFARSPSVVASQAWWHEGRQDARERAFTSDLTSQFSNTEIIKFGLETAQIDGSDNPQTWTWDRGIDLLGTNGTDVRDLKDH